MVKACDACHLRRTKCSGDRPCRGCSVSNLNCTYDRRPRKKGPQGKTVTQLRATLGAGSGSSPSASPISPSSDTIRTTDYISSTTTLGWTQTFPDLFQPGTDLASDFFASWTAASPPTDVSGALKKPSALHTYLFSPPAPDSPFGLPYHSAAAQLRLLDEFLAESTQTFFKYIYPLFPVMDSSTFRKRLTSKVHLYDKQFAALVLSTAVLAILVPSSDPVIAAAARDKADTLTDMAISLHNVSDLGNRPSLDSICTSMMLSSSALILKSPAVAYVRHREAVSLAELLNLTDPRGYDGFDSSEKEVALRMFWLLTCAERSNSLILSRPISLKSASASLPVNFQLQSGLSLSLRPTVRLYELMEPSLIDCINSKCSPQTCSLSTQLALTAHRNLSDLDIGGCVTDVQITDMILSAHWMHIKIWQACVSHSLLNFGTLQPELRIEYPLTCLLEVVNSIQTLPKRSIFGNGHVMGLKLRTIADAAEATLNLPQPLSLPRGWTSVDHVKDALQRLRQLASDVAAVQWSRWLEDAYSPVVE